tara:strand:+ start:182689 stop:183093 length:405 start_codon:yes stop_codon:yes gene_type:complete
MKVQITELFTKLSKVSEVDKIPVTSEQLGALEALVIGYMSVIKVGLSKSAEAEMLKVADSLWDGFFVKDGDTVTMPKEAYDLLVARVKELEAGNESLFNKYAEYAHMCKVMRTEPKFNEWLSEQSPKDPTNDQP